MRQEISYVTCIDCGRSGTLEVGEQNGYSCFTHTFGWTFRSAEGWLCPEHRDPPSELELAALAWLKENTGVPAFPATRTTDPDWEQRGESHHCWHADRPKECICILGTDHDGTECPTRPENAANRARRRFRAVSVHA